ncbi:MAG: M1 family aminopeptidase, partial [Bacteroidota bacterium]
EAYGRGSVIDFPGFKISDSDFQRLSYTEQNPTRGAIYARSWDYTTRGDFGRNSYAKPATVLLTLEGLIGEDTMREILRTYFERWRFNHPTTEDFKQVAEEIAGDRVDVDRFFEQFIYGTVAVDYRLQQLSSQSNDLSGFTTVVRIHRMEEGVLPQTLRVRFADGHEETRSWDGEAEWQTFTFRHGTQAIDAFIDPGDLIRMDLNRLNNRRAYDNADAAETKYAFKLLVWIQQVLSLV